MSGDRRSRRRDREDTSRSDLVRSRSSRRRRRSREPSRRELSWQRERSPRGSSFEPRARRDSPSESRPRRSHESRCRERSRHSSPSKSQSSRYSKTEQDNRPETSTSSHALSIPRVEVYPNPLIPPVTVTTNEPAPSSSNDLIQAFKDVLQTMKTAHSGERFPQINVIPEFDPSKRTQTTDMWILKVNECASIYGWTVHYALPKLVGLAQKLYEGLPSLLFTWS